MFLRERGMQGRLKSKPYFVAEHHTPSTLLKNIFSLSTWLVFFLTSPGIIFLTLAFMEGALGIIEIPSTPYWIPDLLEDSFFTGVFFTYLYFVFYQSRIIWKIWNKKSVLIVVLPILGIQLLIGIFICLIGLEQIFSEFSYTEIDKIAPVFRSLIRFVGETYFFLFWIVSAFISPWVSAYALNRLEGSLFSSRWLLDSLLFTLWPLGIWWLHPRIRKVFSTKKGPTLEDHFVT